MSNPIAPTTTIARPTPRSLVDDPFFFDIPACVGFSSRTLPATDGLAVQQRPPRRT